MAKPIPFDTGHLEAFERAAREGSFTRAADELFLTQPTISTRIAALEESLGCVLFERGGRTLKLTPAGQIFLPFAERALNTLNDGIQAVQRYREGKAGSIAIAAVETPALYLLPAPMARFRHLFPAVDFQLKLRAAPETIEMLVNGDATLGLVGAPIWTKGLQQHAYIREPVYAVTAPHHPLAQMPAPLTVSDLYSHTIYRISLTPQITALVEQIAELARPGSGGALIYIPAVMATSLLIEGQGVAFLPQDFIGKHVEAGRLTFLEIADLPPLYDELLLLSPAGRKLDTPAQAFIDLFRQTWQHLLVD